MKYFIGTIMIMITGLSCTKSGNFNIFSVEDDVQLGMQLRDEILADPEQYPVLDINQHSEAYRYIEAIVQDILESGQVQYRNEFVWEVYLIDDSEVLNAFAAPGGYIFVYTGLLKYLENKDDFVGVMGHEMAHADLRHSTNQLTKQFGVGVLLSILTNGDPGTLSQIVASLVGLKFSRDDETEADTYSVIYLCETSYAADAAASFFEKITSEGSVNPPAFLSTHPNPDDRIQHIHQEADQRNCATSINSSVSEWINFQKLLP